MREGSQKPSGHFEGMSSDDEQAESQQAQIKTEKGWSVGQGQK